MVSPALLGVPDATLGAVLGVAWVVVLGYAAYQYASGNQSRKRFYVTACMGGFWLAYGLLQVANAVSGAAEFGVVLLAVGAFIGGAVAGVRWWRIRDSEAEENASV